MTHRTLQAVLRKLADAGPPASDADLLRRFAADRDEAAFAQLVQRHGRLVWAVCRHLTRSDAEADDAFQATFLVLVRNAAKVRDAGKLSAWLHGVAYRVCSKARQAAKRRTGREAATATSERNGHAVPDSAWDRALAAVHEEVATLPDTLRVPFVLCCLEGKGQTEAAEQLGWKLGTLSGRLTRAKDAVLARLDSRGLTLGAVAAVGLVAPPPGVAAKAAELVRAGFAVPGSILQLSQGVIGMSVNQVKLLAAGLLAACGLGLTAGSGWVSTADAQGKPAPQSPAERVKRLEEELAKAKEEAEKTKQSQDTLRKYREALDDRYTKVRKEPPTAFQTAKWEYEFADMAETFDAANLALFVQEREKAGWEFLGSSALAKNGGVPMWLFRRPKAVTPPPTSALGETTLRGTVLSELTKTKPVEMKPAGDPIKPPPMPKADDTVLSRPVTPPAKPDDEAAIEADIKKLQARLAALKAKDAPGKAWVEIDLSAGKFDPETAGRFLNALLTQKFGSGAAQIIVNKDGLRVYGSKEVADWAQGTVKMLSGK